MKSPKKINQFTIQEVADLNDISVDSLRYYEKIGLLNPKRGANKYRYYSLDDLVLLNIIREFRKLNFSFSQIKDMFEGRNLQSTTQLLYDELDLVEKEIAKLRQTKKTIKQRLSNMTCAFTQMVADIPQVITLPDMKCLHIVDKSNMKYHEIDYYISKYTMEKQIDLSNIIGRYDLYRLDSDNRILPSQCDIKEILVTNNAMRVKPDVVLPGGKYLGISYHGPEFKSGTMVDCLRKYADRHEIRLEGDFYEFRIFDFYDTNVEGEYLSTDCIRLADQ